MKTMSLVKAISMLAVLLAPVAILAQAASEQKALTGVVSDAMCGSTHMMKDKPAAECLRYCVKQGTKYALVSGKSVYTLEGHEAELDKYAAQKVTVKGTLKGETMTVESVFQRSNSGHYSEHSSQALPCNPSIPSFAMMGTVMRAATGSAHHRPNRVLSSNPASSMPDKYVQNSVCFASACMAALPRARPTFRLVLERRGITTKETQARTIPGMLCSGARRDHRSNADS